MYKNKKLLFVLFISIFTVIWSSAYAQEMTLADTKAGIAFKEKNYSVALDEFNLLLDANPGHELITRYIGMTMDRLGRYSEAIAVFRGLLNDHTDDPAVLFNLGGSLYNAKQLDESILVFSKVVELAPDSKYAEFANQYISALSQQLAQIRGRGSPKKFGLFFQSAYQRDDNIPAAPTTRSLAAGSRSGARFQNYLSLDYYFVRNSVWVGSIGISHADTSYLDTQFDPFDVSQSSARLGIQRVTRIANIPSLISANYRFLDIDLDDSGDYSESHTIDLGLRLDLNSRTSTKLYFSRTKDDFRSEGFLPAVSSRDADINTIGLTQYWYYSQRRGVVSLGIEYEDTDADGTNFNKEGKRVNLQVRVPLGWKLTGDIGARYTDYEYPDFSGPVQRRTESWYYSAGLSRWFAGKYLLQLQYSAQDEDSTYDSLTYERNMWGVKFNYVY